MFGKRNNAAEASPRTQARAPAPATSPPRASSPEASLPAPSPALPPPPPPATPPATPTPKPPPIVKAVVDKSEDYYQIKSTIFNALIDTIDLAQLAQLDPDSAREEIRDIVNEIISIKAV